MCSTWSLWEETARGKDQGVVAGIALNLPIGLGDLTYLYFLTGPSVVSTSITIHSCSVSADKSK